MTSNSKQYNNTSIKETKANISLDRYQSNCEKKKPFKIQEEKKRRAYLLMSLAPKEKD